MTSYNIVRPNLEYPVRASLQMGQAGDGYLAFRTPSIWVADSALGVADGVSATPIAAVANRTIRIFKYWLDVAGTVGSVLNILTYFFAGQTVSTHRAAGPDIGLRTCAQFYRDFSPCGVPGNIATAFTIRNNSGVNVDLHWTILYSTEGWAANQNDGSDAL